jgi:hypothetical protein
LAVIFFDGICLFTTRKLDRDYMGEPVIFAYMQLLFRQKFGSKINNRKVFELSTAIATGNFIVGI